MKELIDKYRKEIVDITMTIIVAITFITFVSTVKSCIIDEQLIKSGIYKKNN